MSVCNRSATSENDRASTINDLLLKYSEATKMEYESADHVHYPVELLNTIKPSAFLIHKLILRVRAPVIMAKPTPAQSNCVFVLSLQFVDLRRNKR